MLTTVLFQPAVVYADHSASQTVGMWVYFGVVTMVMLVIAAVAVVSNVRRHVNPHTGLPSRIRRRQRRR